MYFKLFSEIVKLDVRFIENEQWIKKVTNVLNYYANKMSTKQFQKIPQTYVQSLGLKPL